MNTTAPHLRFQCDHCGRFSPVSDTMVVVNLGDGNPIQFCDAQCFCECCAQDGKLTYGRRLLVAFGLTPREHWEGVMARVRSFGGGTSE